MSRRLRDGLDGVLAAVGCPAQRCITRGKSVQWKGRLVHACCGGRRPGGGGKDAKRVIVLAWWRRRWGGSWCCGRLDSKGVEAVCATNVVLFIKAHVSHKCGTNGEALIEQRQYVQFVYSTSIPFGRGERIR
jgi:hypothetical protein